MGSEYPTFNDQAVQLDCRKSNCFYHKNGSCTNKKPALTINSDNVVCWSMKERAEPRIINLDNDNNKDTYYDLSVTPLEQVIKVSLVFSAMVGDELWCNWVEYRVIEILDEMPDWKRQGFTYQKLLIKQIRK